MKKLKAVLISVVVVCALLIGGWFTYTKYELRKAELEYMEYIEKPTGMVGFWSKAEIPISIKLTINDDQIEWVSLSAGGGFAGSFEAGNITIERIYEEEVMASFVLSLDDGGKADFNVYENSFEPRQ